MIVLFMSVYESWWSVPASGKFYELIARNICVSLLPVCGEKVKMDEFYSISPAYSAALKLAS